MSQQKRDKANRQRHALTRLEKLEAQLAQIEKQGYVQTGGLHTGIFYTSKPGSPKYNETITDLQGQITEARKAAGVKSNKSELMFSGSEWQTDWRTGAVPGSPGEDFHRGSLGITQTPSRIGSGGFGDKYTPPNFLEEELGPTKATNPQKGSDQVNVGSGKFATWRPGNEQNQALQIAAAEKNKTTTSPDTAPDTSTKTKPSNSRELRIKNFKPSRIQEQLISGGWTPAELVDLQIRHEDWKKNRGK